MSTPNDAHVDFTGGFFISVVHVGVRYKGHAYTFEVVENDSKDLVQLINKLLDDITTLTIRLDEQTTRVPRRPHE